MVLILGGARSGKSGFAEQLAAGMGGPVLYLATAEALDEEMGERVTAHRLRRPAHWETVEEPLAVAGVIAERGREGDVILLECLTLLVSNLLRGFGEDGPAEIADGGSCEERVLASVNDLISAAHEAGASLIVVSNEVGMGVVPEHPLGRVYRDALGRANQAVAARADSVYLMVAGIPWPIK